MLKKQAQFCLLLCCPLLSFFVFLSFFLSGLSPRWKNTRVPQAVKAERVKALCLGFLQHGYHIHGLI